MSVYTPAGASGNGKYISVAYSSSGAQELTMMCWVYLQDISSTIKSFISCEPNVSIGTLSDGRTLVCRGPSVDTNGSSILQSRWYHLALTVQPSSTTSRRVRLYINGQINIDNVDATSTYATITAFTVTNNQTRGASASGSGSNQRDIKIWTRVLSQIDIIKEMNSHIPNLKDSSLLIWSPFDDDLYTDRSGRGFIWTMTGSSTVLHGGQVQGFYPRNNAIINR